MAWRVAASLLTFRDQINSYSPNRNKASDGTIGDAAHATTTSDHNPWIKDGSMGVVSAMDITHDPNRGVDTWWLAEHLRTHRDNRIKYVISNRRIWSATVSPYVWRAYTGSNPHSSHIHISVKSTKLHYDDTRQWNIGWTPGDEPVFRPILRRGSQGEHVRELQLALDVTVDGHFGPQTESAVLALQALAGLRPDGIVGPLTWAFLDDRTQDTPELRPILRRGSFGEHVRIVQRLLMVVVDGLFGPQTEAEVKKFQEKFDLKPDGIIGPLTWACLDRIEQLPRPINFDEPAELSMPIGEAVNPPYVNDNPFIDAPDRGNDGPPMYDDDL